MKPRKKMGKAAEMDSRLRKTMSISVIGIALVILLSILLLFSTRIVGKATYYQSPDSGQATFGGTLYERTIDVYVDSKAEQFNAVYFNLRAGGDLDWNDPCVNLIEVRSLLTGWDFSEYQCENEELQFGDATINPQEWKSGEQPVAQLVYSIDLPQELLLIFYPLDLMNEKGNDLMAYVDGQNPLSIRLQREEEVAVQTLSQPSSSSQGGSSGSPRPILESGGGSLTCKRDWTCLEWSLCVDGKQSRECVDKNSCSPTKKVGGRTFPVILLGEEEPETVRECTRKEVALVSSPEEGKVVSVVGAEQQLGQPQPTASVGTRAGWAALAIAISLLASVMYWRHRRPHRAEVVMK